MAVPALSNTLDGVDISADVTHLRRTWNLGTPAELVLTVKNADHKYDPANAGSPIAANLVLGKVGRSNANYSAADYGVFYGTLRRIVPHPADRLADLVFEDPLFQFGRRETSVALSQTRSIRDFRAAVLDDIGEPSARRSLAGNLEQNIPFTGADQRDPLSLFEDLDAATGTVDYVQPLATATLYQYVTVDRVTQLSRASEATFAGTAIAGIGNYDETQDSLITSQRVAPTGRTVDGGATTLWERAESLVAGETWVSWDDPALDVQIAYTQVSGAAPTFTAFQQSARITLATGAAIKNITISGRAARTVDQESALVESTATYGTWKGAEISSDFIESEASAYGLADSIVYRYGTPKARPDLTLYNTFPQQLALGLTSRITLNVTALSLSAVDFLILGSSLDVTPGALWETRYELEEVPAIQSWLRLNTPGRGLSGVGTGGKLAH